VAATLHGYDGTDTDAEVAIFDELEALGSARQPDVDAIAELSSRIWVEGPGRPDGRAEGWIRDAVRDWTRVLEQPGHVAGHRVALDPPAAQRLAELTCPTLAVAGTLDFTYVVDTARHLERSAPDARAVVWDDVAHMIGMEQPDRLATEIASFVRTSPMATHG
jgi:pimeloyl-ACP methyl ester carboxylesterase